MGEMLRSGLELLRCQVRILHVGLWLATVLLLWVSVTHLWCLLWHLSWTACSSLHVGVLLRLHELLPLHHCLLLLLLFELL